MTVKEMKNILNQCDDEAEVFVSKYNERLGLDLECPFVCKRVYGELILVPKGDD